MIRLIARSPALAMLVAGAVACCAVVAQSQRQVQKLDTAVLLDAPNVPQMVVDSDGTLHFGPLSVPLPALASLDARQRTPAGCSSRRRPRPREAVWLPYELPR